MKDQVNGGQLGSAPFPLWPKDVETASTAETKTYERQQRLQYYSI